MFESLLAIAAIAFLIKTIKRWRLRRGEDAFARRALKIGAGLDYMPPKAPPAPHDWNQDVQC